jgi:pilus assembly protein CpaF
VDAIAVVEDEVRELVRRRGIDPAEQPSVVRRLVDEVIAHYDERSVSGALPPLPDTRSAARAVFDAVAGFGPLQPYLDDPLVEEIWINEPTKVFIARAGVHELTTTVLCEDQVRDLVEKMLKSSGRRVDLSAPFVDAMLPDGSRLHVVIPDITRRFWSVNIRKFVVRASHLDDLVALGSITPPAARFLDAAVRSGLNVLVSGGTQAGKTTLLNCLAAAVPPQERVVTAEEVFELKIPLPDVVSLQCRQPSLEGTGEIKLRRLVKEALRMRPSRIIVGEVRQEKSLDLLIALNSGLPGFVKAQWAGEQTSGDLLPHLPGPDRRRSRRRSSTRRLPRPGQEARLAGCDCPRGQRRLCLQRQGAPWICGAPRGSRGRSR